MTKYIKFKDIDEKYDFIKLAFTNINVDMKSESDRQAICENLEMNYNNLTYNSQTHSDIVNIVNESNIGQVIEGDALVTNLRNTPILIFVADCVPIALIDTKNKAIALCHAGWRGTYSKITTNAINKMKELYKTDPNDIVCAIGPSIGSCCYEVSQDLIEKFNTIITIKEEKFYIMKEDKYYLDLWKVNELILQESGIRKDNIINLNICTSCNSDKFHSYRKHNQTTKRLGMILEIE